VVTEAGRRTRSVVAEGIGTAFLVAAVVGSGIMGERLAGGNVALALRANTAATGAALVALILTFGPISGAHFNPLVTVAEAWEGIKRFVGLRPEELDTDTLKRRLDEIGRDRHT
jgi:glycerol uptake facilitator-like aquaporin